MSKSLTKKRYLAILCFVILISFIISYYLLRINNKVKKEKINHPLICSDCNIVFVSFDTLRADHVSSYGYGRNTTPTIGQFSEQGFVYTDAISVSSWTLPSSMSWFTGVYPSKHKILNKYTLLSPGKQEVSNLGTLSPDIETLAEVLKKNGLKTGGFTGGAGVHSMFGFGKGFNAYIDDKDFAGFEYTYPKALDWIRDHRNNRFFIFLHGYNIHGEYTPPGGYDFRFLDFKYNGNLTGSKEEEIELREQGLVQGKIFLTKDDIRFITAIYDEKVHRADAEFAKFIEEYKKLGLMDKTVFVLTSDHGEELYDHGRIDHGQTLYEEVIHVPLIITIPGIKGWKIPEQVRSIDLMPTILNILGIKIDDKLQNQFQGVSLIPLMKGEKQELPAFSETDYRYAVFKRSVRTNDRWKLISDLETRINELYNLNNDYNEKSNLSDENKNIYIRLNDLLQNILKGF